MAPRRLITALLLTWTLGLGLIKAGGVQPAYALNLEMVPACSDCTAGCDEQERKSAAENCLVFCMIWCATPGFNAMNDAEPHFIGQAKGGDLPDWEHFHGSTRSARPLLPPPKV